MKDHHHHHTAALTHHTHYIHHTHHTQHNTHTHHLLLSQAALSSPERQEHTLDCWTGLHRAANTAACTATAHNIAQRKRGTRTRPRATHAEQQLTCSTHRSSSQHTFHNICLKIVHERRFLTITSFLLSGSNTVILTSTLLMVHRRLLIH